MPRAGAGRENTRQVVERADVAGLLPGSRLYQRFSSGRVTARPIWLEHSLIEASCQAMETVKKRTAERSGIPPSGG